MEFGDRRPLTASFILSAQRYTQASRQIAFFDELEDKLKQLPGVTAAAISDSLPPAGVTRTQPFSALQVAYAPEHFEGAGGTVKWRYVTPGYFDVLGIPILKGRNFLERIALAARRHHPKPVTRQSPISQRRPLGQARLHQRRALFCRGRSVRQREEQRPCRRGRT